MNTNKYRHKILGVSTFADEAKINWFLNDWFGGDRTVTSWLSEGRAVLLDFDTDNFLKIKGAGYFGKEIIATKNSVDGPPYTDFVSGPPFCVFDFEGKRTIDYSLGHDNAPRGGMSFTQAHHEFYMAKRLAQLEIPTVPCVAYGATGEGRQTSWFSVHLWNKKLDRGRGLTDVPAPTRIAARKRLIRLHLDHGIVGFSSVAKHAEDGLFYSFDLHTLRPTSPDSQSAISMTCNLAWSMTIVWVVVHMFMPSEARQALLSEVYKEIGDGFTAEDRHEFEQWGSVELGGLTTDGQTTESSWKPTYQKGVIKILEDIKSNPISNEIYNRFKMKYPHFD